MIRGKPVGPGVGSIPDGGRSWQLSSSDRAGVALSWGTGSISRKAVLWNVARHASVECVAQRAVRSIRKQDATIDFVGLRAECV